MSKRNQKPQQAVPPPSKKSHLAVAAKVDGSATTEDTKEKPKLPPEWRALVKLVEQPVDLRARDKQARANEVHRAVWAVLQPNENRVQWQIARALGTYPDDPEVIRHWICVVERVLQLAHDQFSGLPVDSDLRLNAEVEPLQFFHRVLRKSNISRDFRTRMTLDHPGFEGQRELKAEIAAQMQGSAFVERLYSLSSDALSGHMRLAARLSEGELKRRLLDEGLLRRGCEETHRTLTTDSAMSSSAAGALRRIGVHADMLRMPLIQALREVAPDLAESKAMRLAKLALWPLDTPQRVILQGSVVSDGEDSDEDERADIRFGISVLDHDAIDERRELFQWLQSQSVRNQIIVLLYLRPFDSTKGFADRMADLLKGGEKPRPQAEIDKVMLEQVEPMLPPLAKLLDKAKDDADAAKRANHQASLYAAKVEESRAQLFEAKRIANLAERSGEYLLRPLAVYRRLVRKLEARHTKLVASAPPHVIGGQARHIPAADIAKLLGLKVSYVIRIVCQLRLSEVELKDTGTPLTKRAA